MGRMPSTASATTCELLTRIATGDDEQAAWAELVRCHGAELFSAALSACGAPDLADDAAQEAVLQIRAGAGRFIPPLTGDPERAARGWMRRIARTCACELMRRRHRQRERERRAHHREPVRTCGEPGADDEHELAPRLREALSELPDAQRQVLLLHYVEGKAYDAVADELGCSSGAARVRAHRGLERLRRRLGAAGLLIGGPIGQQLAAAPIPAAATPAWIAAGAPPTAAAALKAGAIFGGFTIMHTVALSGLAVVASLLLTLTTVTPAAEGPVDLMPKEEAKREEVRHEEPKRDGEREAHRLEGMVISLGDGKARGSFVLRSGDKVHELRPRWVEGGPDKRVVEQVAQLRPGAKVTVAVVVEEGPRATDVKLLTNGPESGRVSGEIVELDKTQGVVVLQAGEHRLQLSPHWSGGMPKDGGGLDKATIAKVREFNPGDTVTIAWTWSERYRIEDITPAR